MQVHSGLVREGEPARYTLGFSWTADRRWKVWAQFVFTVVIFSGAFRLVDLIWH